MAITPALACCPFCGSCWDLSIEEYEVERFSVSCPPCGAAGPCGFSEEDAADIWNRRYMLFRSQPENAQ